VAVLGCEPLPRTHVRGVARRVLTGDGRSVLGSSHGMPRPAPGSGLHQCALCRAEAVVPVWWESVDSEQWHMLLRCGACDTYRDVTVGNDLAAAYERDIDRGVSQIRATLDQLDLERMMKQTDGFVIALNQDLIDAGDFGGR
jgi:hypothetical protein